MFQSISNKPHRFFRKSRGRNRREKDSIFAFLRSRQLMKDNVLFLILNFCGEFADVQGKGIQQRFRQYIFFAAPEKAADSPILLQYAKFTFGLNGAVQAKLFAQICCDSSLRLRTILPKSLRELNRSAYFIAVFKNTAIL